MKMWLHSRSFLNTGRYLSRFNSTLARWGNKDVKRVASEIHKTRFAMTKGDGIVKNSFAKKLAYAKHDDKYLRNMLIYDLENVMNKAKYLPSAVDNENRDNIVKWHYYNVVNYITRVYMVVKETNTEGLVLYAMEDKKEA